MKSIIDVESILFLYLAFSYQFWVSETFARKNYFINSNYNFVSEKKWTKIFRLSRIKIIGDW